MINMHNKHKQEGIKEVEKVKISKKEFESMYELMPDIEESKNIPEVDDGKNFSFEEYTEVFDKDHKKVEDNAS